MDGLGQLRGRAERTKVSASQGSPEKKGSSPAGICNTPSKYARCDGELRFHYPGCPTHMATAREPEVVRGRSTGMVSGALSPGPGERRRQRPCRVLESPYGQFESSSQTLLPSKAAGFDVVVPLRCSPDSTIRPDDCQRPATSTLGRGKQQRACLCRTRIED